MSCQIAFLVDTHVEKRDGDNINYLTNAINLAAFRLLHFLSAKFEKKGIDQISKQPHASLKWGYKFYNSSSCVTRIEQHRLRDFKLKYFEEFENEVQRRLENKPQCLDTTARKVRPSECLTKALTEILSDFPWERPDITSPVKGRKRKREASIATNFVVLFTRCPKSVAELKLFTGRQVPDSEVFLDSLFPPALFQQFCSVSQLSLNWIDVGELNTQTEDPLVLHVDSVQIVQEALKKAKGKLFPASSLVQCGSPYFSNLAAIGLVQEKDNFEEKSPAKFLLPFTTTLESFLFDRKVYCNRNKTDYTAVFQTGENESCVLNLKSPSVNSLSRCDSKEIVPSCFDLETVLRDDAQVPKVFNMIDRPTLQPYSVLLLKDRFLLGRGETFLCSELTQESNDGFTNTGLLAKLIESLKKKNACLVLSCVEVNQLAVLEPLTTCTASLLFVPMGKQLHLEKQLLSQETRVISPDVKATPLDCESLIQRLVTSGQYKKCDDLELPTERSSSKFDPKLMDRWHVTGCSQNKVFSSLINKLNERLNDLDFLTEAETGALKQLQKAYRQENKPPGLRDTSLLSLNDSSQFNTTLDQLSQLDTSSRSSKNTGRQSVSRGELMYSLAKSKDEERDKDSKGKDSGSVGGKKEREKSEIAGQPCEFKTSEELKDYLTSMYQRVLTGEVSSMDSCVQTIVTVVRQYMSQNQSEDTEKCSREFLEECVIVSGSKLREKYSNKPDETNKEEKMVEYQIQVLLRLEVLSSLVNQDQTLGAEDSNDEIVGLLRTLSFLSEPGVLSRFMETKLLYNYVHTIPKTLANIYDELMQPLPELLANQLSPNTSGDQSDLNSSLIGPEDFAGPPSAHTRSHGSVGPASYSSQPGSNKSVGKDMIPASQKGGRKLVHHPSLADFGAKRQIVVQKVQKPKEKSSKKRKRKPSGKSEKDRISKRLFDGGRGGTKLERRQSVAVMERTQKTPKKSKSKYLLKSPKGLKSPRYKMVAETPSHKQLSQVLRRTPGKVKIQDDINEGAEIVEESPVKQVQGGLLQDTPTKAKRAKALLRRSFYSAGPVKRTRNLTKYFQLADKIAGRQRHTSGNNTSLKPKLPKLISFEDPADVKSPSKNSSFLLSQLMASPSPRKKTPRKAAMSPSVGRRTPRRLALHNPSPAKQATLASPSSRKTPRKLVETTSKMITESQSSYTRSKSDGNFRVPSANILMSPVSRRQSPRVLAADSATKMCKESLNKTPVKSPGKSPVCGTITAGLDSPSQNTRLRSSATPTRKSVRAALFAKSPIVKPSNLSAVRIEVTGLQKKLISELQSPGRFLSNDIDDYSLERKLPASRNLSFMSPDKKKSSENLETKSTGNQMMKILETDKINTEKNNESPEKAITSNDKLRNERAVLEKCGSVNFGLTPNSKRGPTIIQRTPSPSKKQKTKTPDSFDKWHRRKPRSSQSSPVIRKQSPVKTNVSAADNNVTEINNSRYVHTDTKQSDIDEGPLRRIGSSQNRNLSISRKRNFVQSPENSFESPGKRQRISRTKSIRIDSTSSQPNFGSQGFDITGSFSEFSQNSGISSTDYLSASNDDVFLSQNYGLSQEDVEMEKIENNQKANFDIRTLSQSGKSWFSPRHKTFERITSGDFSPSRLADQRSKSPVFESAKKGNRNRNISGEKSRLVSVSESPRIQSNSRESPSRSSPCSRKSPGNKKYSPVVSAKSLMHLIQSPLLTHGDDDKNLSESTSPRNHKNIHGDKSRRSLKLQN